MFKAKYVPGETSKAVILDMEGLQQLAADPTLATEFEAAVRVVANAETAYDGFLPVCLCLCLGLSFSWLAAATEPAAAALHAAPPPPCRTCRGAFYVFTNSLYVI